MKAYEQMRTMHKAFGVEMPDKPQMIHAGPLSSNAWMTLTIAACARYVKAQNVVSAPNAPEGIEGKLGGELARRISFMLEELEELAAAKTIEDQADALTDLAVFLFGTFTLMGINPEPLLDIVYNANMGKLGEDGKPILDNQGKWVKPEGWYEKYAPEKLIAAEIARQGGES